jgi:ssDNA-binding Zn-finger/Zn-ribbon topoisomerase 1
MKEMPTATLPPDSVYEYVPDRDEWIVTKKSGYKILSKKEASLNILARLEEIHANLLKQAIQQQDVVDFYLLSLLPPDYLSGDEIGTEHYDALSIFKSIILSLREEYIQRGMQELKDEAETTQWVKAIPDAKMPEQIKPYYKFHESGYHGGHAEEYEDEESEYEFPYSCYGCGVGISEDEAGWFNDESYCESCLDDAILKAIKEEVFYCVTHNVFATDNEELKQFLYPKKVDKLENHNDPEHQLVRYNAGEEIWKEVQENAKKQLELKLRERKQQRERQPKQVRLPTSMAFPEERQPYTKLPGTQSSLKQAGKGRYLGDDGGPWWEAPKSFEGRTSSDYYKLFKYAPWKAMYGGPLWAEVARTINEMEHTTDWQKLMVLIDHFHDLGHNTGKLLDKFPEWHNWFKNLLDQKAKKNSLRYLLQRASGPVKNLVTDYLRTHGKSWVEEEEEKVEEGNWKEGDEALYNGMLVSILRVSPQGVADIKYSDGKTDMVMANELEHLPMPVSNQITFLHKLSKKHQEEAICPSCGEWKTTDFTPKELQEREWECSECMEKRLTRPEDLPENRGQKQITKFDPEFAWLLKLVDVISKAAPEAMAEIKALSKQHPFVTIDDAGDLAAQIWTLATEKYGVPREWLMKQLPEKKANLEKKAGKQEINLGHMPDGWFTVLINPSNREAVGLLNRSQAHELRYSIDNEGTFYVWDAFLGTHFDVIKELKGMGYPVSEFDSTGIVTTEENLIKTFESWRLEQNASLNKKAYEGGYPTEQDSVQFGIAPPGWMANEPWKGSTPESNPEPPIVICPKCGSHEVDQYEK